MADELEDEEIHPIDKRINKALSDKAQAIADRDAALKEKQEIEARALEAQKELDFFKNFNQLASKYQGASDYQDKIKEKVFAGYDPEDATIAILAKEGKYGTNYSSEAPPEAPKEFPAGGSATNTFTGDSPKSAAEMTQQERLAALKSIDDGSLTNTLRDLGKH